MLRLKALHGQREYWGGVVACPFLRHVLDSTKRVALIGATFYSGCPKPLEDQRLVFVRDGRIESAFLDIARGASLFQGLAPLLVNRTVIMTVAADGKGLLILNV